MTPHPHHFTLLLKLGQTEKTEKMIVLFFLKIFSKIYQFQDLHSFYLFLFIWDIKLPFHSCLNTSPPLLAPLTQLEFDIKPNWKEGEERNVPQFLNPLTGRQNKGWILELGLNSVAQGLQDYMAEGRGGVVTYAI